MGWVIRPGQDGSLYWVDGPRALFAAVALVATIHKTRIQGWEAALLMYSESDGPRALFEGVALQGYLEFERRRCYNDGYACGREDGRDGF